MNKNQIKETIINMRYASMGRVAMNTLRKFQGQNGMSFHDLKKVLQDTKRLIVRHDDELKMALETGVDGGMLSIQNDLYKVVETKNRQNTSAREEQTTSTKKISRTGSGTSKTLEETSQEKRPIKNRQNKRVREQRKASVKKIRRTKSPTPEPLQEVLREETPIENSGIEEETTTTFKESSAKISNPNEFQTLQEVKRNENQQNKHDRKKESTGINKISHAKSPISKLQEEALTLNHQEKSAIEEGEISTNNRSRTKSSTSKPLE